MTKAQLDREIEVSNKSGHAINRTNGAIKISDKDGRLILTGHPGTVDKVWLVRLLNEAYF